ncbi:hypothetical protein ACUHMQ_13450 [Chitinimonas sp. PSY-7]|uniref:hypothetical protein n=1 Tax=Chitinimonas sp. PSY-7 TaxID=3459088 RepID=UPI00403FF71B
MKRETGMAESLAGGAVGSNLAAVGGLTVLGVSTGIDPLVLVAALVGAVWSQTAAPPTQFVIRLVGIVGSSVLAVLAAPLAASVITGMPAVPDGVAHPMLAPTLALSIGYLGHRVIMPNVERLVIGLFGSMPGMRGRDDER